MTKLLQAIAFTLSSVAMRAQQVSYKYDAKGNRTSRILTTTNGGNIGNIDGLFMRYFFLANV